MPLLAAAAARVGRHPRRQAANLTFHETAGTPAVVRHPVLQRSLANPGRMLVVRSKNNLQKMLPEDDDEAFAEPVSGGTAQASRSCRPAVGDSDEEAGGDSDLESSPYHPPNGIGEDSDEDEDEGEVGVGLSEDEEAPSKPKGKRQASTRNSKQQNKRHRQAREDERVAFVTTSTSLPSMTSAPSKSLARRLFGPPDHGFAPPASQQSHVRHGSVTLPHAPAPFTAGIPSAHHPTTAFGTAPAHHSIAQATASEDDPDELEGERGSSADNDYSGPASRQHWTFDKRGRLHTRPASVGQEFSHLNAARVHILNYIATDNPWPNVSEEMSFVSRAWTETFDAERDGTVACPGLDNCIFFVLKERISIWRGQVFSAIKNSIIDWYALGPLPGRHDKARELLADFTWVYSHVTDSGKRVGAFGHRAILRATERAFFSHGAVLYGFKFPSLGEQIPPPTVALICTALYAALKSCDGVSGTVRFERKAFADVYEQVLAYYRRKLEAEKVPFRSDYPFRLRTQAAAAANNTTNHLALGMVSDEDEDEEDEDLNTFNPW